MVRPFKYRKFLNMATVGPSHVAASIAGSVLGAVAIAKGFNKWAARKLKIEPGSNVYEYIVQARYTYDMQQKVRESEAAGDLLHALSAATPQSVEQVDEEQEFRLSSLSLSDEPAGYL